ncbi:NAD(P)H-hydrate epimerase [Halogranum gelatinilyticum]|uniref:Bifunctional NAD(P)H-hydrate repair enzyme n=1 Tax=Halogranum gelatinilyticum TaxID=660521 RepID=A0A1G9VSQ9_9EURY|nr:NAD(P)H-hydrate dehydratase [Halogranum gelatinilyticum]SDM75173.1 NAD(P)H-hydrate epimerase [Halogranum gelatinilyticum]
MITAERMAVVDRNAAALGVPQKQLMESSGNAVARAVREASEEGAQVALVCGRGNNGGDALVAARFLKDYDVTVHLLGRAETITTDIARENWDALQDAEFETQVVRDSADLALDDPDVVVDAMLGTGITGSLREPEATAARAINDSDALVVAVDVPSGVDANTGEAAAGAVEADHVVTFHDMKPGLESLKTEVTVADIGIPAAAETFVGPGDLTRLTRKSASHKGDHGEVLVVGGGPYTGAPALAAQAALRAGADLVRVACPNNVADEIQGYSENLIVRPFEGERFTPEAVDHVQSLAAEHDVTVLGPGLGDAQATLTAVSNFLAGFSGTAVVDADALQVVPEVETDADLLCTPHQGELRKMGGETSDDWREREGLVTEFAAEVGHTLLVKGAYDIVSDGETTRIGRTGNPGMTVGGTGDVLAGATGALACTQPLVDAAAIAAYVNGRAGDRVVDRQGYGLVATDLVDELPLALWGDDDE